MLEQRLAAILRRMAISKTLPEFIRTNYEVHEYRHASAILAADCPKELAEIISVLTSFRVHHSEIEVGGGSKSKVAGRIDSELTKLGWKEKKFETKIVVDKVERDSPTHKVDCFKNRVGLEIEWNNKDPFYDRDLNNFRLLFDLNALSVGVIVTRCDDLQKIFESLGRGKSFGNSTTHMSKLLPRLDGGGGGGCPVLVFGIKPSLYVKK